MTGRDHETVFIVGDGQITIHLLDLLNAQTHFLNRAGVRDAFYGLRTHIVAHGHHPFERPQHRTGITRTEHIGEVLNRNSQRLNRRQNVAIVRQSARVATD